MASQVRTIFDQAEAVHAQLDRVVSALVENFPDAAEHLDAARDELLAFCLPWGDLALDLVQ